MFINFGIRTSSTHFDQSYKIGTLTKGFVARLADEPFSVLTFWHSGAQLNYPKLSINLGPFGKSVVLVLFLQSYVNAGYAPFYAQLYLYCTFTHVIILFFIWLLVHFGRKVDD